MSDIARDLECAKAKEDVESLRQRVAELEYAIGLQNVPAQTKDELVALKQSQGEPVAWMYVNTDGECEQIEYGKDSPCEGFTPLYTSAPTIPEGWQLVPIEPTSKMLGFICNCDVDLPSGLYESPVVEVYKAMLAAAPKPEDVK